MSAVPLFHASVFLLSVALEGPDASLFSHRSYIVIYDPHHIIYDPYHIM